MDPRTLGALSIGLAVLTALSIYLAAELRKAQRSRALLEATVELEREKTRTAREQAFQHARLSQLQEELHSFLEEEDLWRAGTTALGRALEASRVAAYTRDPRGAYRLRSQYVAEAVPPLEEGASLPAALVNDRELAERISATDLAVEEDPELQALAGRDRVRSLLVVPLWRAGREGGDGREQAALAIQHCEAPRIWTESERRFVVRLAEHLARFVDHAEQWRALAIDRDLSSGLLRFAQALASAREPASILDIAVSAGGLLAHAARSAILVEHEDRGFAVAAESGFSDEPHRPVLLSLSALGPRLSEAVRERAPVRFELSLAASRPSGRDVRGHRSLVPIFYGRELMGIFVFDENGGGEPIHVETAQTVAHLVAAALKNARLFEALTWSEGTYAALHEESPDLVLMLDEEGVIREGNAAAGRQFDLTRSDLAGRSFEGFLAPDSVASWRRMERELFETGRLREGRVKLRSSDGSSQEALMSAVALPERERRARRARVVLRDVTELRRLEHQLRQSQKLEVVGALAGGIAHDFNNVLGGILGYASLLRTYLKDRPVAAKYVETIERSAVRGAELTGRLLSASRKAPARRDPVSLNVVVEETMDLLAHSFHKRIRIEKRLDPGVRSMMADASQLQQVVLNLCVNARDAMPDGGLLRVSTRVLDSGEKVQLSVEDTGVGMDAKTLARLFEPFFSTKGESGTGLGLSVVYGIVKALGGDVGVKSSPGRGARFDIVLPCHWVDASRPTAESEEPAIGRGELILLVDDEKVLRDLGKDILENHGYRVATVASGEEAIAYFRRSEDRVDLVILDVVMPGMGGNETYRRLRGFDREVPVLLSSGLTAEESVADAIEGGASGFIPKPYGITDLTRAVSAALRRKHPTLVH